MAREEELDRKVSWGEIWKSIISDLQVYSRGKSWLYKFSTVLFSLSFQTLCQYRLIHYLKYKKVLRPIATWLTYIQQKASSCHIHHSAIIGNNFSLPHPCGIVIGAGSIIGDNVTIFQHVTLGSHGRSDSSKEYPWIEDDVVIFAGAVIVGNVHVGKGAVIGANAVVISDVPAEVTVVGVPARPVR